MPLNVRRPDAAPSSAALRSAEDSIGPLYPGSARRRPRLGAGPPGGRSDGWFHDPAPVCTRPAAQDATRRKGEVALPRSPFGVHRPASTGHAHPGTAAAKPTIY